MCYVAGKYILVQTFRLNTHLAQRNIKAKIQVLMHLVNLLYRLRIALLKTTIHSEQLLQQSS